MERRSKREIERVRENYFTYLSGLCCQKAVYVITKKSFDKLRQIHQTFNPNSKSIITGSFVFRTDGHISGYVCVCSYFGYSGK